MDITIDIYHRETNMFKITKYYPNVEILLNPGVYIFDIYSAIGKTYLYKVAEKYRHFGERISGYSYSEYLDNIPMKSRLDNSKYDVCIIDRYDMYYREGISEIQQFVKNGGIVLVATQKGVIPPNQSETCYIEFNNTVIRVTD